MSMNIGIENHSAKLSLLDYIEHVLFNILIGKWCFCSILQVYYCTLNLHFF